MPKLIYSSETAGCGATIKLDSDDFCMISVAQSGVLVRSYRNGNFVGRLFGSFLGPTLYNERNVYRAGKTAMVLSSLYPEQNPSLNFRNPVLSAFANAVWHCSTAAQVSSVLNEAIARAEALPATTAQPSANRAKQSSREAIIGDYGAFMEHNPSLPTRIEDVSVLPHPKEMILDALLTEIGRGHSKHVVEMMQIGAMSAQYQPGIGKKPLEMLGMDISKLPWPQPAPSPARMCAHVR